MKLVLESPRKWLGTRWYQKLGARSSARQSSSLNGGLLVFLIISGILLIRSVRKEVETRERIEKLAKGLEAANERLKELDQLKSEFVSMATHQIRGPLTAMKGYASMILEGDYGDVPAKMLPAVETIFQSSDALTGIVQDFLDVSRIEQGRMKYEFTDFDASALASEVASELEPNIKRKGLTLSVETKPALLIHADKGKIRQVLEDLLDNAQKYTSKGGITVRVGEMDRKVRISIADTGVGISAATLPHLFQKFSRAEDANKANLLGTGLGLYVARELIKANRGRIWAESEGKGKGATFVVELPLIS